LQIINLFNPAIHFRDIDKQLIVKFHNFLSGLGFAQNTIKKHHKDFKKFINRAIDEGKLSVTLEKHPYRGFSVPAKQSNREHLTPSEMQKIKDAQLTGREAEVRDLFLFSCDTGVRFSDTQGDGIKWRNEGIEYTPTKTQKYTSVVRVPYDVMQYPDFVKSSKGNLVKITNPEANRYLKNIMLSCDIDKLLTFHVSRHTFCTNVARKTGNLFKLMKYAGLRKTDTAMIYIHLAGV
jgi:site-specific recombinase XerD